LIIFSQWSAQNNDLFIPAKSFIYTGFLGVRDMPYIAKINTGIS